MATSSPTVSVIVPVFNTRDYLGECLDSVLGQRFEDLEVLCVDDGSTDGSLELLAEYAERDPRVQVIDLGDNRGPGAARNVALERARGEYVACVDSDDLIHEDFVGALYAEAVRDAADVVMCPMAKFSDGGGSERYALCSYAQHIPEELDGRSFTWRELDDVFAIRFASCNKLYRRAFLNEHGIRYPEGIFYEDLLFTFRCLLGAERLRFVRRELYLNRRERQEATTFMLGDRVIDAVAAMDMLERFLSSDERYRELGPRFAAFRFRKLLGYFHKNDAARLPAFFDALQVAAKDPRLDDNPWMNEAQQETRQAVLDNDLQGFLVRELWLARTHHARVRRQREQLRVHNGRLKQRIDRSRLLPIEERWRRVYRRRFRPVVRFGLRRVNSVRRRLPWESARPAEPAPQGASAISQGAAAAAVSTGGAPRETGPADRAGTVAEDSSRSEATGDVLALVHDVDRIDAPARPEQPDSARGRASA